jgi:hypothetical protein
MLVPAMSLFSGRVVYSCEYLRHISQSEVKVRNMSLQFTGQLDLVVLDDLTCDRKRLIAKSLLELSKLDLATRFEPECPRERRVISRNDSI